MMSRFLSLLCSTGLVLLAATTLTKADEDAKLRGGRSVQTSSTSSSTSFTIPGVKRSYMGLRKTNSTTDVEASLQTVDRAVKRDEFNAKRKGLMRAKELGLDKKKRTASNATHSKLQTPGGRKKSQALRTWDHDFDEKGYLIEFTRTNTDCSGKVMAIAGLLTGVTTFVDEWGVTNDDGESKFVHFDGPPYVSRSDNEYEYSFVFLDNANGGGDFDNERLYMWGEQCSKYPDATNQDSFYWDSRDWSFWVSGQIPYSSNLLERGGYFYGHKYTKGSFEQAVSSKHSGAYKLYFDTLRSCQLGVQPTQFYATLIKGQCYFNPTLYNLYPFGEDTKVHSWVKVIGYDLSDQSMKYSIHNNDNCIDFDPYNKAKVHTSKYAYDLNDDDYYNDQFLSSGCYWAEKCDRLNDNGCGNGVAQRNDWVKVVVF